MAIFRHSTFNTQRSTPMTDDTIAAIATPVGQAGIGVLRISGEDALAVADRVFRSAPGHAQAGPSPTKQGSASDFPSPTVHLGIAIDPTSGDALDEVLLTVFRTPRSYTGENVVELSCHGGTATMRRILQSVTSAGARHAEPGEFTKRAFLNGRMDLAQAEAVNDLIRAQTDESRKLALRQLEGSLSRQIKAITSELAEALAGIEASIDFPDDVEEPDSATLQARIATLAGRLRNLLASADRGRIYREGIIVTIAGRPNVGKSSLLNALLRESRAIVTPIPGATRDTIEETINIRGIPVVAIDTAGLRETPDDVERMGVERAEEAIRRAQVVLLVVEPDETPAEDDVELFAGLGDKAAIVVVNKADLRTDDGIRRIVDASASRFGAKTVVAVSALTGDGIGRLEDAVAETVFGGEVPSADSVTVSNLRHKQAIEQAIGSLEHATDTASQGQPIDLISVDLMAARGALGAITGETATEDLIERIFSEFCIGK
jgi:tRNA modification GTPase